MRLTSPTDRLYKIVTDGLCIGCGLCEDIAGASAIQIVETEQHSLRPLASDALTNEAVDEIYRCCPGTHVIGADPAAFEEGTKLDNVWGPWRRATCAHAADPATRFEGATGGVLTALGEFLLESNRVAFIYHVKASETEPTFGQRHISTSKADVQAAAGSRYGPTAMLAGFTKALERNEPFAFIGKSCDISAAKLLGRKDARVGSLVKYWLTPVCGGYLPPEGMEEFLSARDYRREELTAFRYRGRGCPGPTSVATATRSEDYTYMDLWGDGKNGWHLPWRCKICPDGIGEAADIAASDTWIGGSPNAADSKTDLGTNAIVIRTKAGQELYEAAVAAGALTENWDITPDMMSVFQTHQMQKKYNVWARFQGLGDAGSIVPETEWLRLEDLANEMPEAFIEGQRVATRDRVRANRNKEPVPRPFRKGL